VKKSVAITGSIVLAVSLLTTPVAGAVDAGLGVSLNTSGGGNGGYGISMPLRFGNFLVEPELSIYDYSEDETYPLSPTSNRTYESQEYTLETGVYWRQPVIPSVEMYVGGRVGYFHEDASSTYPSNPAVNNSYETSGFYLGPTLGAEYFFNKHFSLGLDVSLLFESATRDRVSSSPYTEDRDEIYYQGRAKLRFYF